MNAIMVIDLQRAFPIPADLVRKIEERARDFPLRIFTQFVNPPGSLFRRKLRRGVCPPGSPEAELILPVFPGDWVLVKHGYGLSDEHVARIKAAGIERVLSAVWTPTRVCWACSFRCSMPGSIAALSRNCAGVPPGSTTRP